MKKIDIVYKKSFLKWFGQNLKRARKESGYSQESLSGLAGMDLSYYGAVERGERAITILKLIKKIARINFGRSALALYA